MLSLPVTLLVTAPFNKQPTCPLSLCVQLGNFWQVVGLVHSQDQICGNHNNQTLKEDSRMIECLSLVGFQFVTILFAQFLSQLPMHHQWSPTTSKEWSFHDPVSHLDGLWTQVVFPTMTGRRCGWSPVSWAAAIFWWLTLVFAQCGTMTVRL